MRIILDEKLNEVAYKISVQCTNITQDIVLKIVRDVMNKSEHGKQTTKKLFEKGEKLDAIPIINTDIQGIQKELKKYGIDFSVTKDQNQKNMFNLYFKAKDSKHIQKSLQNYIQAKNNHKPFRVKLNEAKLKTKKIQKESPEKHREQGAR